MVESVKNYEAVKEIASKHLGKVGGDAYSDQYKLKYLESLTEKVTG